MRPVAGIVALVVAFAAAVAAYWIIVGRSTPQDSGVDAVGGWEIGLVPALVSVAALWVGVRALRKPPDDD